MKCRQTATAYRRLVAVDYTHGCIERTKKAGTDLRYGVDFEHGIPDLLRQTGII